MSDDLLYSCNKSELISIVKEYEEIDISSTTPKGVIVSILDGENPSEHLCPLITIKEDMEDYIQANLRRLRTQLPDCNGKCTTFGCPDGVVVNCHLKLKHMLEKQ